MRIFLYILLGISTILSLISSFQALKMISASASGPEYRAKGIKKLILSLLWLLCNIALIILLHFSAIA